MPEDGQIFECYTTANNDEVTLIAATGNKQGVWQRFASGDFNDAAMYSVDKLSNINAIRPSNCHYEHVRYENGKYQAMPYHATPFICGDGFVNIPRTNQFTFLYVQGSENKEWMVMTFGTMVYTIFCNGPTEQKYVLYTNEFDTASEADTYMKKKLNEKTKKGYLDGGTTKCSYDESNNSLIFS